MGVNDAKSVKREATRHYLEDRDRVDELLEALAEGESLRDLCRRLDLVYPTTMRFLAQQYPDEYEAAKIVRADSALDEMADIERRLENSVDRQGMDFNSARELLKSKQWRAERLNPRRYSPKQTIDMNYTDKTKLHLDALREMTRITVVPAGPALGHDVPIANQITATDTDFTEVQSTTESTVAPAIAADTPADQQ